MFGSSAFLQLLALFSATYAARPQPPADNPPAPDDRQDRTYTIVTGEALRRALTGKLVHAVACYSSDQCAVVFGGDGRTYYRHGDRVPWQRGSYAIHVDQVCAVVPPGAETCHLLFRSELGRFALVRADDPSLRAEAVRITDAAGIPLPD